MNIVRLMGVQWCIYWVLLTIWFVTLVGAGWAVEEADPDFWLKSCALMTAAMLVAGGPKVTS